MVVYRRALSLTRRSRPLTVRLGRGKSALSRADWHSVARLRRGDLAQPAKAGCLNRLAATSEPSSFSRDNSFPLGRQPAFSRLCKARVAERPRAPLAACPRCMGPAARRTGPQEAGSSPCRQSFLHRDGDAQSSPPARKGSELRNPPSSETLRARKTPSSETLRAQKPSELRSG